jgi:cytosine/adenosine deaminase-related metal-dependent hydrolase
MPRICIAAAICALLALASGARSGAQQATVIAIERVSVVPMDREHVLTDQTVTIRNGLIVDVSAAGRTAIPPGAARVDGGGKFLIPALAEMHAHVPAGGASDAEDVLFLYVANGIGTIRSMLGDPSHFDLRERARSGKIVAPTMYLSGPSFSGQTVTTAQGAEARVAEQKKAGYDLLKIHPGLSRGVFDAMASAAGKAGIRFAGHVPADVGLQRALEAKYWTIDHVDGYVEALARPGAPTAEFFGINLVDHIDESRIPSLVAGTKAAGTWIVPTQILIENWYGATDVDTMRAWPEMPYAPRNQVDQWIAAKRNYTIAYSADHRQRYIALRRKLIKSLHDGGVGLLLGSDAPQTWNVPGFSIHRELATYVAAGLTPYQALATGTRNVAMHLGSADRAGTIEVGKRADLVLLEANPLQDISNTSRITGVMIGGRWLSKNDLDRRLNDIRK